MTTPNPSISSITADATDAELSALIAEHVAGWTDILNPGDRVMTGCDSRGGRGIVPSFATDANAVLPLLEKLPYSVDFKHHQNPELYRVIIREALGAYHRGDSSTFARAAAFALLKSRGFTITPS